MVDFEFACECGHELTIHDEYGCAAFLGAYEETRDLHAYCACKRTGLISMNREPDLLEAR